MASTAAAGQATPHGLDTTQRMPAAAAEFDLSVVVPVFNELPSLEPLLSEIETACNGLGRSFEILFVDDGSTDGTRQLLERWAQERAHVRVVELRQHSGKSAALSAGFWHGRGLSIVAIDGDRQDDPAAIPMLLDALDEGYDVVSGWRLPRRDPRAKRVASRIFNAAASRLSGLPIHDFASGIKAYRRECARSLRLYGDRHRFIPLIASQLGWRVGELRVNHRRREHGRSKFGPERYFRAPLDLVAVILIGRYRDRPLHLFGLLALYLTAAGLTLIGALAGLAIAGVGVHPDAYVLAASALLVLAAIQLFAIGLVGELVVAHCNRTALANEPGKPVVGDASLEPTAPARYEPVEPGSAAPKAVD